jgi:hypothetical protein
MEDPVEPRTHQKHDVGVLQRQGAGRRSHEMPDISDRVTLASRAKTRSGPLYTNTAINQSKLDVKRIRVSMGLIDSLTGKQSSICGDPRPFSVLRLNGPGFSRGYSISIT